MTDLEQKALGMVNAQFREPWYKTWQDVPQGVFARAILQAADLIETQAREIERLREALQFYARKYNWKSCGVYMCGHSNPSSAEIDRGNKARAALAGDSHDQ